MSMPLVVKFWASCQCDLLQLEASGRAEHLHSFRPFKR